MTQKDDIEAVASKLLITPRGGWSHIERAEAVIATLEARGWRKCAPAVAPGCEDPFAQQDYESNA